MEIQNSTTTALQVFSRQDVKYKTQDFQQCCGSGSGLDPDWIRIQWGPWIRTRIRNPDPDPGGQKWPTKIEKKLKNIIFQKFQLYFFFFIFCHRNPGS